MDTYLDMPGCCTGCGDCYGSALGCHQSPCSCDSPTLLPQCDNCKHWSGPIDAGPRLGEGICATLSRGATKCATTGPTFKCSGWQPC